MPPTHRLLLVTLTAVLARTAAGQEPESAPPTAPPAAAAPLATSPQPVHLHYPRDEKVGIAIVGGRTLTLGDLVDHIDARHHPRFKAALREHPTIEAMLRSDLMAPWVRHFADIEAIQQTFNDPPVDAAQLEASQSEALRQGFQGWLDSYTEQLRQQGRPTEFTQSRINSLLSDWQLRNGMACELQGWLNHLEKGDYPVGVVREFFTNNARAFGGQVTISHILVQHRDGGTGLLLNEEGQNRANARLADIRARLRPDGSNFEEIAALYSDDTRTGRNGGRLEGLQRWDDRMPAALCRAAWSLRDGEVGKDVVETQYGWHLVKRIELQQNVLMLFSDATLPKFRIGMQRAMQEKRLFEAREKTGLRLLL